MYTGKTWLTGLVGVTGGIAGGIIGAFIFSLLPFRAAPAHVAAAKTVTEHTVRVHNLEIVGPIGKVRARIKVASDGMVRLSFFSPKEKRRLAMGVLGDGEPAMGMYDSHGNPRIGLNLTADDAAGLRLMDVNGMARMRLDELQNGITTLAVMSKTGRIIWSAPHRTEGANRSAKCGPQAGSSKSALRSVKKPRQSALRLIQFGGLQNSEMSQNEAETAGH